MIHKTKSDKVLCYGCPGKIEVQKMIQSPFGLLSPGQYRPCTPQEIRAAQKRAVQKSVLDDPNDCFDPVFFGPDFAPVKTAAKKSANASDDANEIFDAVFPWQGPEAF